MNVETLKFRGAPTERTCLGSQVNGERARDVPISTVSRWGKGRTWGNRTGWIVAELLDGSVLFGRMNWQTPEVARLLAPVSKVMTPRESGYNAYAAINWTEIKIA